MHIIIVFIVILLSRGRRGALSDLFFLVLLNIYIQAPSIISPVIQGMAAGTQNCLSEAASRSG